MDNKPVQITVDKDTNYNKDIQTVNVRFTPTVWVSFFMSRHFLLLILFLTSSLISRSQRPPLKEFRGVWVATVNNIDWPSAPGLSVERQKKEFCDLLAQFEKFNLNAVILQVRPAADAFYRSATEPWSYFLSGKQGVPPEEGFDPLQYAIDLCHQRGMELHAWFNPFRVRNFGAYNLDPTSFAGRNPKYLRNFDNKLFFDPGIPQVRKHIVRVIMEVVRNYNIDAVHFDDYFYPYPVKGKPFPDQYTFKQYGKKYYPNQLANWRRHNIDQFIQDLHDSIKAVKPNLPLGVSPFGVWRNKSDDPEGSPGDKGTNSYDDLYADVYKWLKNDWIDYIIPQLYWEQGDRFGDFAQLAQWWNDHSCGKKLYLGQALYKSTRYGTDKYFVNPSEIVDQIRILRKFEHVGGFAFYSASHIGRLSESITNDLYAYLAPEKQKPLAGQKTSTASQNSESRNLSAGIREENIKANRRSIDAILNSRSNENILVELPTPKDFQVRRIEEGYQLTWTINQEITFKQEPAFAILVFEPVRGGGYHKRVYKTTSAHQIILPRKGDIRLSRVLFGIVSVDEDGHQSHFPRLFRIRGKRIVFN